MGKSLIAHGTTCNFYQPIINAIPMKNVEAGEHAAVRLVDNWVEADDTLRDEVFSVFHSYKGSFDFLIGRLRKTALNFEMCPSDSFDERVLGLVVPSARPIHLSVIESVIRVFLILASVILCLLSVVLI